MGEKSAAGGIAWFLRRPWDAVIAGVAALAVAVLLGMGASAALPSTLENIFSGAADGRTAVSIPGSSAAVVVPEGWRVRTEEEGAVTVITPDGALEATLRAAEASADAALRGILPPAHGTIRTETLASGLQIAHADGGDNAIHAAVRLDEGRSLLVSGVVGGELRDYRRAFGELLEGVRP